MSCSVAEFWILAQESGLLSESRCRDLAQSWQTMKGAARTSSARTLAEWLVAEHDLTRYQAKLLLAGQPGPFYYSDYCLTKRLRRGGLADCFQAVHAPTQFPVTLRFVRGSALEPGTELGEVRRLFEAAWDGDDQADGTFRPQVVPFYEWVDCGAYQFGVFGRVEGEPVSHVLAQEGPPELATACHTLRQAAAAVAGLHEAGRALGSVRLDTIWLGEGRVGVLPRELAESWQTLLGGTPWFRGSGGRKALRAAEFTAPESAGRLAVPTPAADVYSLGCVLYALLTGHPPFRGTTVADVLQQHATESAPAFADVRRWSADDSPMDRRDRHELHPDLESLLARMLAKDPADRPANARQVVEALRALAGSEHDNSPIDDAYGERQAAYRSWHMRARQAATAAAGAVPLAIPLAGEAAEVEGAPAPLAVPLGVDRDLVIPAPLSVGHRATPEVAPSARRRPPLDGRLLFVGLASAMAAAAAVAIWHVVQRDSAAGRPHGDAAESRTDSPGSATATRIANDEDSLWASPTSGLPISTRYLPDGTQGILSLRLANLLAHPEGDRIVAAAGPFVGKLLRRLPTEIGFEASEIEQLIVGWRAGAASSAPGSVAGDPSYAVGLVLHLQRRVSLADLSGRLADAEEAVIEGQRILVRGSAAFMVAPNGAMPVVVVAPVADVQPILQRQGDPPLRREIERLLAVSDAARHVTLLAPNSLLLGDGRAILMQHAATLREPLQSLLGEETQGLLLSAHWGDDFFLELAAVAAIDMAPFTLRSTLADRLWELPQRVEDFVLAHHAQPYGRRVLARLPEMMRRLVAQTRSATEADRAVFRAYLPIAAGHNLLMAGEIALAESQLVGVAPSEAASEPAAGSAQPAHERLAKVTSLSFARDTLEAALATLADDIGVPIAILGSDLQLEGITKNQSFSIAVENRPARDVLIEILRLANPDKAAAGPDDPRQKLIYVLKDDAAGAETIYVTTRTAAEQRGDELPDEFRRQE